MARRTDMTREHAALLLGVDESASADDVQRAWKVWVRLAHPDAGGDRDHFEALMHARRVLMANVVQANAVEANTAPAAQQAVPDRPSLCSVVRRPSRGAAIVLVGVAIIALASPVVTLSLVPWLSAAIMGGCAAGLAVGATRALLGDCGDVGHRITCVSLLWLLVACGQVGL
ncbi:MAG: hypothetical protein EBY51_04795, partial [Actinobacteria bacterium]|nr:hypothetical protein [Actinomycetota bacterium]